MIKQGLIAISAAAMAVTATPALADPPSWAPAHGRRAHERQAMYDNYGRYYEPRRIESSRQMWRGDDGRYYCRRQNGTTGLVIGAGLGALAGHQIAGRGNRAVGAVVGGAAGALLGREIARGSLSCR